MELPCAPYPPSVSVSEHVIKSGDAREDTSCTVTYQPPTDDGGAPLTGYILERRTPGPDSEWIKVNDSPVTDLPYTVDNLTPATEYEFRVAAVNKKGIGYFSQVSTKIITVGKPVKPDPPKVAGITGTSVRLKWTAPKTNVRAPITQYIVMFRTSEVEDTITVDSMESMISYKIKNRLKAHTKYRFAVAAVNIKGQGPWSEMTEEVRTSGTLTI